jgi:hypothetical protein
MTELLPDHRVIEQVAVGTLNDPEVLQLILGVQAMQQELGIGLVLIDCTDLTQGPAPISIIDLAEVVAQRGIEPGWREALVRPSDPWARMSVDLWVAACNNRGIVAQSFRDRDSALAWLTQD